MAKQLNVNLNFTADISQAEKNLAQLKSSLNAIATTTAPGGFALTKDMQAAVASAKELQQHMSAAFDTKTGNLDLSKLNTSLKNANTSLSTLSADLLRAGSAGEQAFMAVQRAVSSANVQINQANGLLSQFFTTLKNTARWQISSSILHGFMGALQSAWGYAKNLDESLNNIRIVTGYNTDQMAEFANQANKAAKALHTTTTAYTDASLIYYQQGLSDAEVLERTNVTVKMANVTGKAAAEVSDQLTSIWNNFDDGSKSLEYYADVITALGAATASSTDEISEGLEKFAAVAETVGLSYEYATAALATVTAETRQSADVVGTAFKTLFARLQDLELGETLDDGTTLGKYSAALNAVGINIKDTNGELKDMDQILDELGGKWKNLSKDTQVALAQTVAGTRQYTQLVALMDNWSIFQTNLGTAKNAKGALQDQADIYAESWDAAIKKVRASAEGIYNNLFPMDKLTKMADGFATLLDGVSGLVAGLGGLKGILLLVSTIVLNTFSSQIGNAIQSANDKLAKFSFSLGGIQNLVKPASVKVAEINTHLAEVTNSSKTANQQVEYFNEHLKEGASLAGIESQNLVDIALKQEYITESVRQYETNLSKINNIQTLIAKAGKQLTSEQREQLAAQQQQLIALNEQHQVELEKLATLKREHELLISEPGENASDIDNWQIDEQGNTGYVTSMMATNDQRKSLQTYFAAWNNGLDNVNERISNTGNLITTNGTHLQINIEDQEKFNQVSEDSLRAYSRIVSLNKQIKGILSDTTITEEDRKKAVEDLVVAAEKEGGIVGMTAKKYSKVANNATELARQMKASESGARNFALACGGSEKQVRAIKKNIQDINVQAGKVNQSAALLNNNFDKVVSTLSKALNNVSNFGNSVTRIAQGFSSVAMGISSVKSAIDTLGDADATWVEKLSAGAMGATMGLQALMTVMKGVSAVAAALNTVQSVNNTLNASAVVLSGQKTAAQAKEVLGETAKIIASKAGTSATKEEIVAEAASILQTELGMGADTAAATAKLLYAGATKNSAIVLEAETGAKAADTAITNAGTAANIAYAASSWLACPPLLIIAAVLAAIIILVVAIVKARQNEIKANEELAESSRKAADAYKAEADAHKELIDSYKDALKAYEDTGEGKEAVIQAALKAAQAYGIEGAAVLALSGNYDTLTKKLDAARKKELKEQREKQKSAIGTTTTAMTDDILKGMGRRTGSGGYAAQFGDGWSAEDESIMYGAIYAKKWQYLSKSGNALHANVKDRSDPYAMYGYYKELQEITAMVEEEARKSGANLGTVETYQNAKKELAEGAEEFEKLEAYIQELRKTEMEYAALDAQERIKDGRVDSIAEYLKFEEDYLSQYEEVLKAQGLKEDSQEYKDALNEAKVYVASLDDDIAKLQAEARGFDDLTTEKNKEEMDKIKAFYETLGSQEQELFWTMGVDQDTSLDSVKEYMSYAQKYLDSNNLFARIEVKDKIMQAYESGDYKTLKTLYGKSNSLYKLSWNEFLQLSPKEAEKYLKSATINYDQIETGLQGTLEGNKAAIERAENQLKNKQTSLSIAESRRQNEVYEAQSKVDSFDEAVKSVFNNDGTLQSKNNSETQYKTNFQAKLAKLLEGTENTDQARNVEGFAFDLSQSTTAPMGNWNDLAQDIYNSLQGTDILKSIIGNEKDQAIAVQTIKNLLYAEDVLTDSDIYNDDNVQPNSSKLMTLLAEYLRKPLTDSVDSTVAYWNGEVEKKEGEVKTANITLENLVNTQQATTLQQIQIAARKRHDELEQLAQEYGLDFEEMEKYQELLVFNNPNLETHAGLINQITLANFRLTQGAKEAVDNFVDWNNILIDSNATLEQIATITPEVQKAIGNFFNMDEQTLSLLPVDFIQQNWNLLSEVFQGSQEAYDQMQVLLAKTFGQYSQFNEETLLKIAEDTTLSVGDTVAGNENEIAKQLQSIAAQAWRNARQRGLETDEVAEYVSNVMSALGYSLNLNYDDEGNINYFSGFTKLNDSEVRNLQDIFAELNEEAKATGKTLDEVLERYYEINNQLDDMTDAMDDANRELDKMYGKARISQMEKVNNLLTKEIGLLEEKAEWNVGYAEIDRINLDNQLKLRNFELKDSDDNIINGFEYDDKGNITNFTQVMKAIIAQSDVIYDDLNKRTSAESRATYEKETLQPFTEWMEKVIEYAKTYKETIEEGEDIQNEIADAWSEWQTRNSEILNLKLELKISINDRELEYIENKINNMSDDFYQMAEVAGLLADKGKILNNNMLENAYLELQHARGAVNEKGDAWLTDADYYASLEEMLSQVYSNIDAIKQLDDTMMSYYGDTLAAAGEELAKFTTQMEHQSSVLDHYKSIMTAIGKEVDYKSMGVILKGQSELLGDQYGVAKQNYEMLAGETQEKYNAWQKALKDNKDAEAELYKAEYEAALQASNEAQNQYLELASKWAEALKAELENTLADLDKTLEEALTGGTTFDRLNTTMERTRSLQEEYLTTTNKVYETNKLMRQAQQEIDKISNTSAKRRLQAYIQETQQLQGQSKLSQYELEIQQAKYDLLLAEIALEEAQNAKSTVRLQRDSEGNFGYVYTADQNAIDDASQNLADAQNSLYNLGLQGANEYTEKIIQLNSEMYDQLVELHKAKADGEFKTEEEYQEAVTELQNHWNEQRMNYSNLYSVALTTDSAVVADAWSTDVQYMIDASADWSTKVNEYVAGVTGAFADWESKVATIANDTTGTDLGTLATKVGEITDKSKDLVDVLDGEDGLLALMQTELDNVSKQTEHYATLRDRLLETAAAYDGLASSMKGALKIANGDDANQTTYYSYVDENGDEIGHYSSAEEAAKAAWEAKHLKGTMSVEDVNNLVINSYLAENGKETMTDSSTVGDYSTGWQVRPNINTGTGENVEAPGPSVLPDSGGTNAPPAPETPEGPGTSGAVTLPKYKSYAYKHFGWLSSVPYPSAEMAAQNAIDPSDEIGYMEHDMLTHWSKGTWHRLGVAKDYLGTLSVSSPTIGNPSIAPPGGIGMLPIQSPGIIPFASGGYTGAWGSYGKLAMLHEKELVLNKQQTQDLLLSMEVLERILQTIDLQSVNSQIGGILSSPGFSNPGNGILEQNVHIEASFPNATNHSEIEEAFGNLVNLASQYANRK